MKGPALAGPFVVVVDEQVYRPSVKTRRPVEHRLRTLFG
jgi:hypothetical protein